MSNAIILLAIAGIAATYFIGSGGIKKIEDLIPKDLKEKVSDKANDATNTPTEKKENDVIPESENKKLTKELEQKLPTTDNIPKYKQVEDLKQKVLDANLGQKDESQTIGMSKQSQVQERLARELLIPDEIKYSTSLNGSSMVSGVQFTRGSQTEKEIQKREAERAQTISTLLYGNVQNPKFVKTEKPANTTTTAKSKSTATASKTVAPTNLEIALSKGNTSALAKELLAQRKK